MPAHTLLRVRWPDTSNTSANVLTVSTACAAGLDAIGLAARDIVSGVADYVVAGGTDCAIGVTPLAEFVNSGLSSVRNSCPEKASRPFDVFADSGVCAEGAGLFLIEEKSAARARGATILAEIAGYGSCLDHDRSGLEADGPPAFARPWIVRDGRRRWSILSRLGGQDIP